MCQFRENGKLLHTDYDYLEFPTFVEKLSSNKLNCNS